MKKITVTAYETSDGRVFLDEADAKQHEVALEQTKYYRVQYDFDLTEGRGYFRNGLVIVTAPCGHEGLVTDYCYERFGNKRVYLMGRVHPNAAADAWAFQEVHHPQEWRQLEVLDRISMG